MDHAQPQTRISADGHWWWNGSEWVAATTDDGLWRWNGSEWVFTLEAAREDPAALVAELGRLALGRFSEAGAVLVRRRGEWEVPLELAARIEAAAARLARLDELQAFLDEREAQPETGLAGIIGRLAGSDDPAAVEREERRVVAELEPMLAEIAKEAPRPSLKEADELCGHGRVLESAAAEIASANAEVLAADQAEAERLAVAEEGLVAAEEERARALEGHRAAVESALAARDQRLSRARAELAALRAPGPGAVVAEFGGFTCYELAVEAPGGARGPLAGARAEARSARELARDWPQIIDDLLLTESPGSERFQSAEASEGEEEIFLLVITPLGSWLRPCGSAEASPAAEFATALNAAAAAAATAASERAAAVAAARRRLEAGAADRSEIAAAEQALSKAEADPDLLAPVEAARERLEAERAATGEAQAKRAALQARVDELTSPPPPLSAET